MIVVAIFNVPAVIPMYTLDSFVFFIVITALYTRNEVRHFILSGQFGFTRQLQVLSEIFALFLSAIVLLISGKPL